jgi:hypothetical protein
MGFQVGVDFPVKIVQQGGVPPALFVFAKFAGVEAHGSLYRQHVPDEVLILNVFADDR